MHEGIATHLDFREQKKPRSRLIARMGKYVGLSEDVESGLEALDADCLKFARKRRNNPHDNVSHTALITSTNTPPTLCLKVPKSPSKKLHASRAFQQYQDCAPISINNFFRILLIF